MSEIKFSSHMYVKLVDHMGSDLSLARAARVSVAEDTREITPEKLKGLIRYLMAHRHGSPFEHGSMTFLVEAPIFVFREFHRHRIGFSYNEVSGRYAELEPKFYVPDESRPLLNNGTSARPHFIHMSVEDQATSQFVIRDAYTEAWYAYKQLLSLDVAKEVARSVLPVGIYSRMYVTCNPRSLMAFLSLRTASEEATYKSYPQFEIQMVARQMEGVFMSLFPVTHEAFDVAGRVGP